MESGCEHLSIKKLSAEDRPREKLLQKGRASLTDAELVAILIHSGNKTQTAVQLAQSILRKCDYDLNKLSKLTVNDLTKFNGIGEAKAISIVSALEIGRRRDTTKPAINIAISSSKEVYKYFKENLMDLPHEEFWLLMLKHNNEVIKKQMISKGGVSGTVVDPKIIFKLALEETASKIIIIHNHSSGNLSPSEQDKKITRKIKQAGEVLDIELLDHLIFTNESFFSFSEEGIM